MKTFQKIQFDPVIPYEDNDYADVQCSEFGVKGISADGDLVGYDKTSPMCMSCSLHVICPFLAHAKTKAIKISEIKTELNQEFFLDESNLFHIELVDRYLKEVHNSCKYPCNSTDLLEKFELDTKQVFNSLDPEAPKVLLRRLCNTYNLSPNYKLHLIPTDSYEISHNG